jgi:hypothetical protein
MNADICIPCCTALNGVVLNMDLLEQAPEQKNNVISQICTQESIK